MNKDLTQIFHSTLHILRDEGHITQKDVKELYSELISRALKNKDKSEKVAKIEEKGHKIAFSGVNIKGRWQ